MLEQATGVLAGLALLVYGGQRTVDGASAIARRAGLSTFFVGVTLVATGSSIPEVTTATYAAVYGAGDIAVGHIVGSATSQITLGVGVIGLLSPLSVVRSKVRIYGGGMIVAMSLMGLALWSGTITQVEGAALAVAYVVFLIGLYEHEDFGDVRDPSERVRGAGHAAALVVVGLALVLVGGHLLVTRGQTLATTLSVPPYLIGLLTGLGTTTPEVIIAALAVRRDRGGIAVGTLLGSNITDPLFSLGVAAAAGHITVTNLGSALSSVGYMILVSAVVVALFYRRGTLDRPMGAACVTLYGVSLLVV